jgi:hypothetical protein
MAEPAWDVEEPVAGGWSVPERVATSTGEFPAGSGPAGSDAPATGPRSYSAGPGSADSFGSGSDSYPAGFGSVGSLVSGSGAFPATGSASADSFGSDSSALPTTGFHRSDSFGSELSAHPTTGFHGSDAFGSDSGAFPVTGSGSVGSFGSGSGAFPATNSGSAASFGSDSGAFLAVNSGPAASFGAGSRAYPPTGSGSVGSFGSGSGAFPAVNSGSVDSFGSGAYPTTGSGSADAFAAGSGWPDNSVGDGRPDNARPDAGRGPDTTGSPALPGDRLPPRQPRVVTLGMAILGVVVLLAGTVIGVVYFSGDDNSLPKMLSLGSDNSGPRRTVSAPLDNRNTATFELLAAVSTVHVSIGELGDDLYRISTPDDAGIKPSPVIKVDDVQLQVTKDGNGTASEVDVVLSAAVRWELRFSGYADQQQIDLSNGDISSVAMTAGMHTAELELPTPDGTVPVTISGAVDQLTMRSPADSPVRVEVGGGARNVVAGSRTLRDMPAGSTLTPKDWKAQSNRYDVTASAAIGSLNVENLT